MLEVDDVTVSFGAVRAVAGVSLSVGPTEVVGVVGPNGSGKTTLLNAITGVVPAQGRVVLDGRPLALGRPERIRRAGVVRTFQAPQVLAALSCLENVMVASEDRRLEGLVGSWLARPGMWAHDRRRVSAAYAALERVGLAGKADRPGAALTYGEQRLLELARVMVVTPKILALDEPGAGLNDGELVHLGRLLAGLRDQGLPILVVDHKIDFLDRLCDRIVVLEMGRVVAAGTPDEVWSDPHVINAYLGVADA